MRFLQTLKHARSTCCDFIFLISNYRFKNNNEASIFNFLYCFYFFLENIREMKMDMNMIQKFYSYVSMLYKTLHGIKRQLRKLLLLYNDPNRNHWISLFKYVLMEQNLFFLVLDKIISLPHNLYFLQTYLRMSRIW